MSSRLLLSSIPAFDMSTRREQFLRLLNELSDEQLLEEPWEDVAQELGIDLEALDRALDEESDPNDVRDQLEAQDADIAKSIRQALTEAYDAIAALTSDKNVGLYYSLAYGYAERVASKLPDCDTSSEIWDKFQIFHICTPISLWSEMGEWARKAWIDSNVPSFRRVCVHLSDNCVAEFTSKLTDEELRQAVVEWRRSSLRAPFDQWLVDMDPASTSLVSRSEHLYFFDV